MLPVSTVPNTTERQTVACGVTLLRRSETPHWVTYLESGRVGLGVLEGEVLEHQLGVLEGPVWLEATTAVLNLPSAVDAVSQTEVCLRRVPLSEFRQSLGNLNSSAQAVLHDVALAHRQQTEMAVSRLAKDAESRCAEWLLRHAETGDGGTLCVPLHQRKRLIAAQLGIAPETLSRVLRHLRERNLISGSGRVLNLVDPSALRALSGA
jgi:CRP-like cAMP-binding protein